jgi:hypothetical protein
VAASQTHLELGFEVVLASICHVDMQNERLIAFLVQQRICDLSVEFDFDSRGIE